MKPTTGAPAGRRAAARARSSRRAARPASRRGTTDPARSRRPAGRRRGRRRRSRRRRRGPSRPCAASATSERSSVSEPRSQSASRRSTGDSRSCSCCCWIISTVMQPPGTARRCGRRSRTRWTGRRQACRRCPAAAGLVRDVVEVEPFLRALVVRASAARSGRAARGSWRPPPRRRRRRAGARSPTSARRPGRRWSPSTSLMRDRLGAVVERRRGAVRVDVDDVLRAVARVLERALHRRDRARRRPCPGAVRW